MNSHVAEPFRSLLASVGGDNMPNLQAEVERMAVNIARKKMGNDVLRVMLSAKPLGAQAQVDAVIEFCGAERLK